VTRAPRAVQHKQFVDLCSLDDINQNLQAEISSYQGF